MADSTSTSLLSLSRFLSLETDAELAAEDDDEEHWMSLIEEDEEYLRILLEKEGDGNRIESHVDDWIRIARSEAIDWIFNTRSIHQFRFHTAYLSVTYIDRFLSKEHLASEKPWAVRLLAIACLSLAAKMNDRKNWANWRLQSDEFVVFPMSVIQRMELLVLSKLDWRMRSITPFHFIRYFISCFCKESSSPPPPQRRLISLISQIVCAATNDMNIMGQRSSSVAMAATLMAIDQEDLSRESMEMKVKTVWINQLFDQVDVYTCYREMLKLEPLKVSTLKPDSTNNEENSSKRRESIKRKRS